MALSRHLRTHSKTIKSKLAHVVAAFAKSLEVIPSQLTHNAGFDPTDVLGDLRAKHAKATPSQPVWAGVNIEKQGTIDAMQLFIWEPALVKKNALGAATEAACIILSVDETVRNPAAQENFNDDRIAPGPGRR